MYLRGQVVPDRKYLLCYFCRGQTDAFLIDQKILILAGFIAFSKSKNTYNYIASARFTRDYL